MDRKRYLTKLIVSNESIGMSTSPLGKFSNASILELIDFLNKVSDEEVLTILQKHKNCEAKKLTTFQNREIFSGQEKR